MLYNSYVRGDKPIDAVEALDMLRGILNDLRDLDEAGLREVNKAAIRQLKLIRAAQSKAVKMSLCEGDTVKWNGRKGRQTGTVTSIKRKYAHVNTAMGSWRIPMNMLTVVTKNTN
jgi:hypothetical protein